MSHLLTYPPGWNLDVPAGTYVIRADVVMNTRPGAGGYCAILEASDLPEIVLLRGGHPSTDTKTMLKTLAKKLAEEIRGNRAVVLCRTQVIQQELAGVFKPYKMIRILGNSPIAVADATRHAAVMAERGFQRRSLAPTHPDYGKAYYERLVSARYQVQSEEFHEAQDSGVVHRSLSALIKQVGFGDLTREDVRKAAQEALDATDSHRIAMQKDAIRSLTVNDIPKPTKERSLDSE